MDLNLSSNLAFHPIEKKTLHDLYQTHKLAFWSPEEIDMSTDRSSFDAQTPHLQKYVKFILSLFAQLDGLVNENLIKNFKQETSDLAKECKHFYSIQEFMETIHNETYSILLETYIRDTNERSQMLDSIKYNPSVRMIADWACGWMDSSKPLLERLIAFACIEGLVFSSAFAGIYWIKRKGILGGLTKANEWIARDEAIHTRFAIALYHHMTSIWKRLPPLSQRRVHEIVESAVDITEKFTRDAMHPDLVGIDIDDMIDYVKCTADVLIESLGYERLYNVVNPFDWMIIISLPNKTNFFESKVSEYARDTESVFVFDLNTEF
jgi:ribonucleoside-diphosphate reductase subunit M2